jgi:hypothetical protein
LGLGSQLGSGYRLGAAFFWLFWCVGIGYTPGLDWCLDTQMGCVVVFLSRPLTPFEHFDAKRWQHVIHVRIRNYSKHLHTVLFLLS